MGNMSQNWARTVLDIPVAFSENLTRVREILRVVAHDLWEDVDYHPDILEEPEVWGVEAFGPDGVAIRLVVKTSPSAQFKVMRELRQRMKAAFDAEGIEIPFPRRTVWVRPEGATLPAAEETNGHAPSESETKAPGPTPRRG